jgi:cytochrome bd-type quinol oxidase subunit 2
MTTAAISSASNHSVGGLRSWLSVRHSLCVEAAGALTLYGLYELARGLVGADTAEADGHARRLVALERSLHLFDEAKVQRAVQTLPGLTSLLGVAYLTLHLAVTAGVLLLLHRRRPEGFAFVRTALLLASGLALVGFLVYPTAPPRLPASASPTPSPAATSTSTAASSARCTTRTPPCRACMSATR